MLFRTRVFLAFSTLGAMAVGGAVLLIFSAQLNERFQTRTALAYETLSAYFELSGEMFRTFKLARRDLLSRDGQLAGDFQGRRETVLATVERLETALSAEARFVETLGTKQDAPDASALRRELMEALDAIDQAAALIESGDDVAGRTLAVLVLESRVDIRIANLMDEAIELESQQLEDARASLRDFHAKIRIAAWTMVALASLVTFVVLFLLVRRFSYALGRLVDATQAYAEDRLDQRIDLHGQDELSDVARRMEAMAGQILTKRQDLERIREELEQRVAERTAQLSEVNQELEARERRRRRFFADIGHELRTPVTAIRGEAEVALRAKKDHDTAQRDALAQIVSLTERLTDSVNDLFFLAREQAGMLDLRNTEMDLNAPARQAVTEMRALIEDAGADVRLRLSETEVQIEGDFARLSQLVRLLVSNALSHAQQGVEIDVGTRSNGSEATLYVADNGPGVPEADRKRIFDRYARGDRAEKCGASGTGLGLAIAKSIAGAHGGTICVTDSESGGAEFRVSFPLGEAPR